MELNIVSGHLKPGGQGRKASQRWSLAWAVLFYRWHVTPLETREDDEVGAGTGGNGTINVPASPESGDGKMGLLLLTVSSLLLSHLLKQRENLWNDLSSFHWKDRSNSEPLTAISEGPVIYCGTNKGTSSLGKYFWLPSKLSFCLAFSIYY